jgi:hypothetical protein
MHTYPSPLPGQDQVSGVEGGFGQVLASRFASRGDALNIAVDRMVWGVRCTRSDVGFCEQREVVVDEKRMVNYFGRVDRSIQPSRLC